ncbi:MAG: NAD(P)H-dependent oxidoreductase subunit E [Cyanobacteriota bacterium]|nr:NAD(P)H-dependent oxidoreductase subunit E [Cyanobacteriota bacterium]
MRTESPPRPGPSTPPGPARLDDGKRIAQIARRLGGRADALIEVLHQVQELHGYLPPSALAQVARELRLPLSRVWGVASFYHLFRLEPPTAHRCAVCLGTACFVNGGGDLARELEARLGVRLDDPAGNGLWALQHVSCLGACGQAPVLVVDGVMHTRLPVDDPASLSRQLDRAGLPQGSAEAAPHG